MDNKAKISAKDMVLNEDHVLETGSMTARVPRGGDGIFSIIILILSVKNLKKALLSASLKAGATGVVGPTQFTVSKRTLGFLLFNVTS